MVKYGTNLWSNVYAKIIIDGMEIFAQKLLHVVGEEYSINKFRNVSVLRTCFGMECFVWFHQPVVVVRHGILKIFSVNAHKISIMMAQIVSYVQMGEIGTIIKRSVNVLQKPIGMENFASLKKIVKQEKFGTQIL